MIQMGDNVHREQGHIVEQPVHVVGPPALIGAGCPTEPAVRLRPGRRAGIVRGLLVVVAVVLVGLGVLGAVRIWTHVAGLREALADISAALDTAPSDPLGAAGVLRERIPAAQTELDAVRPVAAPAASVLGWIGSVPLIGRPAGQISALWTFADATMSAASALTSMATVLDAGSDATPVTARLADAAPDLVRHIQQAHADFERAQAARSVIGEPAWPLERLQPYLAHWDSAAPRAGAVLATASDTAPALVQALGTDRPVTYLVLVQTSDELRATGGFITSVGSVRIERGRVTAVAFEKVYDAEGVDVGGPPPADRGPDVAPPAPIQRYLGAPRLALRDANWWADFPTSARTAASFWSQLKGQSVDGVIAFDEAALEGVLEAVGPVEVAGAGTVTAANVKQLTLGEVYQGVGPTAWYARQSAFSQDLATAVLAAAQRLPPERLPFALGRLRAVVDRRDLMVALFAPEGATALDRLGVDGAVGADLDDYLYVVESNVSYNKLSPFIRQDLQYAVQLGADGWPRAAALTVDEANTYQPGRGLTGYPVGYYVGWYPDDESGGLAAQLGFYGGYTRALVPTGSQLTGATGLADPESGPSIAEERGRTAIGWYSGLPMGSHRQTTLRWVPAGRPTVPGQYRLLIQRQPGAPIHTLTVRVSLPTGSEAGAVSPPPAQIEDGAVVWRVSLETDVRLEVTLQPSQAVRSGP
jgi:hypothetical protein